MYRLIYLPTIKLVSSLRHLVILLRAIVNLLILFNWSWNCKRTLINTVRLTHIEIWFKFSFSIQSILLDQTNVADHLRVLHKLPTTWSHGSSSHQRAIIEGRARSDTDGIFRDLWHYSQSPLIPFSGSSGDNFFEYSFFIKLEQFFVNLIRKTAVNEVF